jgi:ACR3 family arsenite efflux pump ArsB
MFWKLLQAVNRNLTVAIPSAMLAGLALGLLTDAARLKGAILPLTFLMVYPMMVTLKIRQVFTGGDTRAQLLSQLINFGVIPFLAFGVARVFFGDDPYLALGVLLAGLVPTSGMTISWTGLARGNVAAAVKMTVVGLTLGAIATPFYVKLLLGRAIEMQIGAVLQQIALIVLLPMAAGALTQWALVARLGPQRFQQRWAPRFPGLSTLGVLGIVLLAMALKARAMADEPHRLLVILAPLALIYLANYLISTLVGRMFLPRGDAIALVYGTVMRNLSIALAIAINAFGSGGSSAALVVAVAYIIQVQSAAWYVKFTQRIYGADPAPLPAAA